MRWAKTPFARCPCTKTAICAGAVNHPHHINPMNHSSDKCQPALIHALLPVNPSIRRKRASSPACARPARPRARPSPAPRLPCCAQNFLPNLTQSLANSRLTLLHLHVPLTFQSIGQRGDSYRLPAARIPLRFPRCPCTKPATCAAALNHPHHINPMNHSSNKCQPAPVHALTPVQPLHPPPKGLQRGPCAATASAMLRPKFLAQSHTFSRHLSCNAPASRLPVNPFNRPKNASNVNPV